MNITMNIFTIYPMGGGGILVIKSEYQNDQGCVHGGEGNKSNFFPGKKNLNIKMRWDVSMGGVKVNHQIPVFTGKKI